MGRDFRLTGEVMVSFCHPLTEILPTRWKRPLRHQAVLVVVHIVIMAGLYNRKNDYGGFVPVSKAWVREIVGCPMGTDALSVLIKARVLESDGKYIRGVKSTGYRFHKKFLRYGFTIRSAPKRFSKRIRQARRRKLRVAIGANPIFGELFRIQNTVSLAGEVWQFLRSPISRGELLGRAYRILAVEDVRRRHWYFSHDEKTGRCFNNVTNCPKDVRPFLLIGGQPTAECDIANSQPMFLAEIAYGNTQSDERTLFVELVRSGQFYETVRGWAGLEHLPRELIKKRIYTGILFGRNHWKSKLWDALANRLPLLAAFIERTKVPKHNALALALQTKEADVMLGRIVPRLLAERRPVLSIHDGCLCRAVDAEHVRRVIEEEVETAIGIKPTVRVKRGRATETEGNTETGGSAP